VICAGIWAYCAQINIAVHARGVVRPEVEAVQVRSETAGRIVAIGIREGSLVRTGDVLLQLDDHDLRDRERSLLEQIHETERHLAWTVERSSDRSLLAATYRELEQCRLDATRRSIVSPVAGRVVNLANLRIGEEVNTGAPVAWIGKTQQALIIEAWLPTADRLLVAPKQLVRIQLDSVSGAGHGAFDGSVESVAPDAVFNPSGIGAYRVVVRPASSVHQLIAGMTLRVHFITGQERLLFVLFHRVEREFNNDGG
jgi:multidrug efflux pump subunit AcrA (membrane-fusion protein)